MSIKKFVLGFSVVALMLGVIAIPAKALTTDEQIAALMRQFDPNVADRFGQWLLIRSQEKVEV